MAIDPRKDRASVVLLKQGVGKIVKEGTTNEEIYPCELVDTSDKEAIIKSTGEAGAKVPLTVAKEQGFIGKGLDDAYGDGDNIKYLCLTQYQEAQVMLAEGENVQAGDILTPDGAEFVEFDGEAHDFKAVRALEDVDNSGEAEATRIKVEVL